MSSGENNASSPTGGAASRSRKKLTEAERIKEMEKAALSAAILKPFIESLFDDSRDGSGGSSSSSSHAKDKDRGATGSLTHYVSAATELPLLPAVSATIGMSGMPSMRYSDALQRETAKPFRLNTLVSIDAAPLPTRTSAPVYMELLQARTGVAPQHAACLDHSYRQHLRDSFTQVLRSGAMTNSPSKAMEHQKGDTYHRMHFGEEEESEESQRLEKELIAKSNQLAGLGGGSGGNVRPPDIYNSVKQGQMLEDAHLEMLMKTVKQVKERAMFDTMWGTAQGRFAW